MDRQLEFKLNTAHVAEIISHLEACSDLFVPPLRTRIEIPVYAEKLHAHADTFEAWKDSQLVGLVAAYSEETGSFGFITNVSVLPGFGSKGIASKLMQNYHQYAQENGIAEAKLEVSSSNFLAQRFYIKLGYLQDGSHLENLIFKYVFKKFKS